jgi:hypothetical protein
MCDCVHTITIVQIRVRENKKKIKQRNTPRNLFEENKTENIEKDPKCYRAITIYLFVTLECKIVLSFTTLLFPMQAMLLFLNLKNQVHLKLTI